MYIAPGIHQDVWHGLELDDDKIENWEKAIDILRKRIFSRYIEPVDILIEKDKNRNALERRYGFTILAIDCLLIETLQAFKDGLTDTKGKSKSIFVRFLRTSSSFKKYFQTDKDAEKFYEHYRCGILHQAEVGEDSLVWSVGDLKGEINGKQYVNRSKIHEFLKNDFNQYLGDLKDPNDKLLRNNFRKKMDFITRK